MSLIKFANGKENSRYGLLFGDPQIALLISKIHSAMVSSRHELLSHMEAVIKEVRPSNIVDMDTMICGNFDKSQSYYVFRPLTPKNTALAYFAGDTVSTIEIVTGLRYDRTHGKQVCDNAVSAAKAVGEQVVAHGFTVHIPIVCGFFAKTTDDVNIALTDQCPEDVIICTGDVLCDLLELDHKMFTSQFKRMQSQNRKYFFDSVAGIRTGMAI